MAENISKNPPKGKVKFDITLSDEQKSAKTAVLYHPYNFIMGKAGSGTTLLAVQIALDMFFTRKINQIIITRPTVSNEDNGYLPGSLDEKMEPWLVPILIAVPYSLHTFINGKNLFLILEISALY